MKRFIIVCFSILVLLNVFDGINTHIVLQNPNGIEANPIVNSIMEKTDVTTGIVLSKSFVILSSLFLTFLCWKYYPSKIRKSFVVGVYCVALIFYTLVVIYSSLLILFVM